MAVYNIPTSVFGRGVLLACACVSIAWIESLARAGEGAEWPGFRGARGDGVSSETGVFGEGRARLNIAWKRPLGKGYSSVSVASSRVVTMFSDGKLDVVIALDTADGREIWRHAMDDTYRGHDGSQDGPISTPCIADDRVFALSPRGKLVALDLATGDPIWQTDLVKDHAAVKPHWGFGTSPLVAGGVLVVQVGAKDSMVCGFDPKTGARLWGTGDDSPYYQSPVPLTNDDRVLVAGNKKLFCIAPKSGALLWQFAHNGDGEYGSICMVPIAIDERRVFLDHHDDRAMLVEIPRDGEKVEARPLWEEASFSRSYSVAVSHGDLIFGYNGRTSTCVDVQTGKPIWRSRQPGDGFPILVDGHLAILTKDGSLHVAKAARSGYEEVASIKVFTDLAWAPPSFSRGSFFARSLGEIARIDVQSGSSPVLAQSAGAPSVGGTRFGKFLDELQRATDKAAAIDQFLAGAGPFPMIEADGRVVFVYRGPGRDLAVGGDITGYGRKLPMQRVPDTDLFYTVARLESDARVSYAFVRDFRALTDPLNSRKTMVEGFDDDLEFTFTPGPRELSWLAMPRWSPPDHLAEPAESRRGRIEKHTIRSQALDAEISIDVYTPAGYESMTERLPVAYLYGGPLAREQLRIPTVLDNLIGRRVAPLIAVFVYRDPPFFNFEPYTRMIAQEVRAYIDERYRTDPSRQGRAHIAWGAGSLAALHAVLSHSEVVGKLGLQSPWVMQVRDYDSIMKDATVTPLTLYMDWGKYDSRSPLEFWSVAEMGHKLDQYFRARGYVPVGGEARDGSGAASWENRIDDLFEALFPMPK